MSKANEHQVGGSHYKSPGLPEHWDLVAMFGWDYFQGQITKYVMRWRKKNGIEDLKKARHYLDKYIEVEEKRIADEIQCNVDGDGPLGSHPGTWRKGQPFSEISICGGQSVQSLDATEMQKIEKPDLIRLPCDHSQYKSNEHGRYCPCGAQMWDAGD